MTIKKTAKRSIIAVALILIAAAGAFASGAADMPAASGTMDVQVIQSGEFTDLYVSGIEQLAINQGDEASIVISGDTELMKAVDITNDAGYLSIVADSRHALDLDVEITVPELNGMMLCSETVATLGAWDTEADLSVILDDDSVLNTAAVLTADSLHLFNKGGLGGTLNIDVQKLEVESDAGALVFTGTAVETSADVDLNAELNMNGLAVQEGYIIAANDGVVTADFPGVSSVSITSFQDASVSIDMNGAIQAFAYGDSSISADGDIAARQTIAADDASVSVG